MFKLLYSAGKYRTLLFSAVLVGHKAQIISENVSRRYVILFISNFMLIFGFKSCYRRHVHTFIMFIEISGKKP